MLVFSMWLSDRLAKAAQRWRLYGALTPESGARASVLLTRAVARLLLRPGGPEVERQPTEALERIIRSTYPLADEDAAFLNAAQAEMRRAERDPDLRQVGMDTASFSNAIGVFSLRALEIASGYGNARAPSPVPATGPN